MSRTKNFISVYHVISLVKSGGALFQVQHCDSMVPLVVLKARLVSVWVKDESCYSRLISSTAITRVIITISDLVT